MTFLEYRDLCDRLVSAGLIYLPVPLRADILFEGVEIIVSALRNDRK